MFALRLLAPRKDSVNDEVVELLLDIGHKCVTAH
jgi:hypothetical protein